VSTRETKKLATDAMWSTGRPRRCRSARPATYAFITAACASRPNSSVTLTLIPSAVTRRIASTPAGVAGILIMAFVRSRRDHRSRAAATVASASSASAGATSRLT